MFHVKHKNTKSSAGSRETFFEKAEKRCETLILQYFQNLENTISCIHKKEGHKFLFPVE